MKSFVLALAALALLVCVGDAQAQCGARRVGLFNRSVCANGQCSLNSQAAVAVAPAVGVQVAPVATSASSAASAGSTAPLAGQLVMPQFVAPQAAVQVQTAPATVAVQAAPATVLAAPVVAVRPRARILGSRSVSRSRSVSVSRSGW